MPREGRATEPWELREVLLDRSEMESPPTGVRDPSPEWRFITEDSWRGQEEGEERREKGRRGGRRGGEGREKEDKEEKRGRRRGQGVEEEEEEDASFSLLARHYRNMATCTKL